jgi:hypothetical protein
MLCYVVASAGGSADGHMKGVWVFNNCLTIDYKQKD